MSPTMSKLTISLAAAGLVVFFVGLFFGAMALSHVIYPPAQDAAPETADSMDRWKLELVALLQRNQQFPDGMDCQQGTVQLAFQLDRQGRIVDSQIKASSGIPAFDTEALDLLARIKRFPAPPASAPDVMSFTVPVRFEPSQDGCSPN